MLRHEESDDFIMADGRIIVETPDGSRIWLNPQQVLKMEKTPDGRYFIRMVNGENYAVDKRTAGKLEDYFEDL